MIQPARRNNLYEEITNQILSLISDGNWKEGERVPGEIELSRQFEVSRNSIREALKALALIGILRARSGSGTFVALGAIERIAHLNRSPAYETVTMAEIMEARLAMEPGVVLLATKCATQDDFARMQGALDSCFRAFREKNYDFELGLSFHYMLFQIAGNKILCGVMDQLKDKLVGVRSTIFLKHIDDKVLLRELSEHQQILSHMKAGNADAAASLMAKHIEISLQTLRDHDVMEK